MAVSAWFCPLVSDEVIDWFWWDWLNVLLAFLCFLKRWRNIKQTEISLIREKCLKTQITSGSNIISKYWSGSEKLQLQKRLRVSGADLQSLEEIDDDKVLCWSVWHVLSANQSKSLSSVVNCCINETDWLIVLIVAALIHFVQRWFIESEVRIWISSQSTHTMTLLLAVKHKLNVFKGNNKTI